MSMVCRFSPVTGKEFLHQRQPGVGKWSLMGQIWPISLETDLNA